MTSGRNGRGNAVDPIELFAEPAYIRSRRDGPKEPVYVTQGRWNSYLQFIGAQAERGREAYDRKIIDEQGLGTNLFHIYNSARNTVTRLASQERNLGLIAERMSDITRIIPEAVPAGA